MQNTKIYAECLEPSALSQFYDAMKEPYVVRGALMPDAHTGYSLPIGAVVATSGKVVPAWVGYDIGCGMCAVPTTFKKQDIIDNDRDIFYQIYRDIPTGTNHNKTPGKWNYNAYSRTATLDKLFKEKGLLQLASLGSGNHFIEIGYDESDTVWIIIHSGSRGIGKITASHYMKIASGTQKAREGNFALDVDSDDGKAYITDMNFCLEFALENRKQMIQRVINALQRYCFGKGDMERLINRNHNHATLKDGLWIHRKGATHAEDGMMGVIPGNMRDGSFIVRGKGNPDSLWSSSHGAGRVLSRRAAKQDLSIDEFKDSMKGIKAKVCSATLDESPNAYKDIFEVMTLQSDLVEVVNHVKPLINIKA